LMSGDLILSGILVTRRDDVIHAADGGGATLRDERVKGEWWCGRLSAR
jgi:ribosomal protein L11 methylase PrmA